MIFEVFLGVCERAKERSGRTERRRGPRRIRKRRRYERGAVGLRVIVNGLKGGMEMGAIVVIAVDNMAVVMAVRIRCAIAMVVLHIVVVAGIDIIV